MDSIPNESEGQKGTTGNETDPKPTGDQEPVARFTQADLDRIAGKARQEERAKYPDYDELKTAREQLVELERAKLSREEQLTADLAKSERGRADADERIASALIEAAVKVTAAQMGIIDPEVAAQIVDRSGISYSAENGVVGVNTALETLVTEKAYLKGDGAIRAPNLNPGGKPAETAVSLTVDQRDVARVLFPHMSPAEAEAEYKKGIES